MKCDHHYKESDGYKVSWWQLKHSDSKSKPNFRNGILILNEIEFIALFWQAMLMVF